MRDLLPDFETVGIDLPGATIHARVGGSGPPLLLLHGYPQTHAMWHPIAVELAKSHRVIATDLRGYGASVCKDDNFTFRAMATDQVKVMQALGHDRFDVVSHDRGARTAHRMVLDHPEATSLVRLACLASALRWHPLARGCGCPAVLSGSVVGGLLPTCLLLKLRTDRGAISVLHPVT